MLWLVFGLMLLTAALVVAWPQYREEKRVSIRAMLAIVSVLVVSAGIYTKTGQPDARIVINENSSVDEMVESLALRLESDKDDVKGWKMLARSLTQLKRYPEAIKAYEHAAELEGYSDGQTLADFGETIMLSDDSTIRGRAGELFENALVISPNNPKALFYGGIVAIERDEPLVAAERWETLLASSPPPEIEGIMRQRIAEWRGTDLAAVLPTAATGNSVELTIDVQIDAAASQAIAAETTIFIIARDPAQPSPPVAAVRRLASELPFSVTLSDADSMIPGRTLSNFRNLELIVRASISGQPVAQSGDWFGSQIIDTDSTRNLEIVISRQVP